jgi:hypothetical protein
MPRLLKYRFFLWIWVAGCIGVNAPFAPASVAATNVILFNRDIRPILSDTCYPCHGFDANKRKADLRLDTPEGAMQVLKGRQAVKPGDLAGSEVWRRVTSSDPQLVMPPPDSHKALKPEQVAALRHWIEEGAKFQKHWAFEAPVRGELPEVKGKEWPKTAVDRFILATLEGKKLKPTPEASRETLIRRVTLELTGFPPTPAEVDAFLADTAPDAYERVVDRLLKSPFYGEHMARYWLDVARYGDTHGLHLDNERSMWPYRDWVVRAFNENLGFDDFTVWQLAGDLLPNPTREQLVASGFNRCNVSTSEGGAIDEEFRVRYAVDRVETTSAAWMGLTMGCAVCHDHKLDPITQKEFFQVSSIFNNISENAMDGNALLPPPSLALPTSTQEKEIADLEVRLKDLNAAARERVASLNYIDPVTITNAPPPQPTTRVWIDEDFPAGAALKVNEGNPANQWVGRTEGQVFSEEKAIKRVGKGLHQVFFTNAEHPLVLAANDTLFAYVFIDPADVPKAIMLQFHADTWKFRANWGEEDIIPYGAKNTPEKLLMGPLPKAGEWVRLEVEVAKFGLPSGTKITGLAFTMWDGTAFWDKAGQVTANDPAHDPSLSLAAWELSERKAGDKSTATGEIKALLKKKPAELTPEESKQLRGYFLTAVYADPENAVIPLRTEIKTARDRRSEIDKQIVSTLISRELEKPRPTYVLIRGEYDKHGEAVGPGVPGVLPGLPPSEKTNRLTFARWLVDPKHPLTARVTVNRFWQQVFGTGLVKTAEDFGTKGEWPSHPELLDWLATEFMSNGWDVKALMKLMVTSATYRQDSRVTRELLDVDPENRLLARGPRNRLDAEVLRDNALFLSGLINLKVGGRGVRPYQPGGIWEAVAYTTSDTAKYSPDEGGALYRRSLYTFWKRTAPPPSMTIFDAPSREQCRVRRERTNTPLQALVTMNDPQYFEAARQLGYRMIHEGGEAEATRLAYGFRLVTARAPAEKEKSILSGTLKELRSRFEGDPEAAKKAIAVGNSKPSCEVAPAELAAYTLLASLLLNLDEVVTKN